MEALFVKENLTPLNGEITGEGNEYNQNGGNGQDQNERRDKRGNEIKKGVAYKITFKD